MAIDREVMYLAAIAAGIDVASQHADGAIVKRKRGDWPESTHWDPRRSAEDLLTLAEACGMVLDLSGRIHGEVRFWLPEDMDSRGKRFPKGDRTALAEAIVLAAAEMQRAKESTGKETT